MYNRHRYGPAQLLDIGLILRAVELHQLDDTLSYQRRSVVYGLVDEYANGRDILPQDIPQLRRLFVCHAAAAAGKDKSDVVRQQFISPIDIAAPRQAAQLDLNRDDLPSALPRPLFCRRCA